MSPAPYDPTRQTYTNDLSRIDYAHGPVRRPSGLVYCAEPPKYMGDPCRSCSSNDLFLVAEGTQCGNCLAVNGIALDKWRGCECGREVEP